MNYEECALWDRIVADYLDNSYSRAVEVEEAVSVGADIADVAIAERQKRFTAVPVENWKSAKFALTVGTCCYCEAWPVHVYQRGNVFFGCEKCTGLAPQDADAKLPGGT